MLNNDEIARLKLPLEFMKNELAFSHKVAEELYKDKNVLNFIYNFSELNGEEIQKFGVYLIEKLNTFFPDGKKVSYYLGNYIGSGAYNYNQNAVILPKNTDQIVNPIKFIQTLVHEQLGHGRQKFLQYDQDCDKEARKILYLQLEQGNRVVSTEDYTNYLHQPIEEHARLLEEGFLKKFIQMEEGLNLAHQHYTKIENNRALQEISSIIKQNPENLIRYKSNSGEGFVKGFKKTPPKDTGRKGGRWTDFISKD